MQARSAGRWGFPVPALRFRSGQFKALNPHPKQGASEAQRDALHGLQAHKLVVAACCRVAAHNPVIATQSGSLIEEQHHGFLEHSRRHVWNR
jgi:hypothetical protein